MDKKQQNQPGTQRRQPPGQQQPGPQRREGNQPPSQERERDEDFDE